MRHTLKGMKVSPIQQLRFSFYSQRYDIFFDPTLYTLIIEIKSFGKLNKVYKVYTCNERKKINILTFTQSDMDIDRYIDKHIKIHLRLSRLIRGIHNE